MAGKLAGIGGREVATIDEIERQQKEHDCQTGVNQQCHDIECDKGRLASSLAVSSDSGSIAPTRHNRRAPQCRAPPPSRPKYSFTAPARCGADLAERPGQPARAQREWQHAGDIETALLVPGHPAHKPSAAPSRLAPEVD